MSGGYTTGVHLSILIILCVVRLIWCDNNLNPDWEEPDAFSKRKMVSSGKPSQQNGVNQPECPDCLNDNLSLLYKKLAKFLLNRKNMKFDESSRTFYRMLHIHISEEQMNRFDGLTDVHDMDQFIFEMLHQSRSGTFELFKEVYFTWKDTAIWCWERIMASRQIVLGLQFAGFVLIWFASKRFKFSFSIVGLFFVLFYLYSFLDSECHRKKEIEKAAQMFGMNQDNPCKSTSFWTYYFGNHNHECKKYLDNSYETSCTLVDVYEEFVDVFVYKQMWNFIDSSVANILKVYATYGIIGALVVTSICIYLFNNYVKLIIKSTFHHFFSPRTNGSRSSNGTAAISISGSNDTISTEVLNKILEITRDQTKLNALHLTRMTSNSGVQPIDTVDSSNECAESNRNGENLNVAEVETVRTIAMTVIVSDEESTVAKIDS